MDNYIDLDRRFRELTAEELEDPELLASLSDREFGGNSSWPELLKSPRILLLAEAGSGKTFELRAQTLRLKAEGKFAFFVPLETLGRGTLANAISADDARDFAKWKADGLAPAWFFLDAVDELKLTQRKLDEALNTFAKEIDGLLDRVRVILSCRPSDWRAALDMTTFRQRLPYVSPSSLPGTTSDEYFRRSLEEHRTTSSSSEDDSQKLERTVILLPLNEARIEAYARQRGVHDPGAFAAEIHKEDAWVFARRPLDCSELIALWTTKGRLGTRIEQHEANVATKLRDDPDRADRHILSDARAREGAERVALALTLTRMRSVLVPARSSEEAAPTGALDSAQVLADWNEAERKALVRTALFDPATFGRVRFHHSSVQEYLAACRLRYLRDKGMPARKLLGFCFATTYGADVVIPSMRPVAAWLAIWDHDVRRNLVEREPEILLTLGDPGSLPIDARRVLLRRFAALYGAGGWRGIDIPWTELRRLVHPELAETIREVWKAAPTNGDVRKLLLELIWLGSIASCADIAIEAASNANLPAYERVIAVRAVLACNQREAARQIAKEAAAGTAAWPESYLHHLAQELFPEFLNVADLLRLVERAPRLRETATGFNWTLQQIARKLEPGGPQAVELRKGLAELILRTRDPEVKWHQFTGKFAKHSAALAILCDRALDSKTSVDETLIDACTIANRFGRDLLDSREAQKLARHFVPQSGYRESAFWRELALLTQLAPESDEFRSLFHVEYEGLAGSLDQSDRAWLEAAATSAHDGLRRAVALAGLVQLWAWRGRVEAEALPIRSLVADDARLLAYAVRHTARVEPDLEIRRLDRNNERRKRIREGREKQRIDGWLDWRKEVLADVALAFSPDQLQATIRNFYKWLDGQGRSRNRFSAWNADVVNEAFNRETTERLAGAFANAWRLERPTLWSQRLASERNSTPYVWIYGLTGLSAESSSPGWAHKLSHEEARLAACYATIELNGFPEWLVALASADSAAVLEVLGEELDAEVALVKQEKHLPLLQDLGHAAQPIKLLLVPRVLEGLRNWPKFEADDEIEEHLNLHLSSMLQIIQECAIGQEREDARSLCVARARETGHYPTSLIWLRALFKLDAPHAANLLLKELDAADGPQAASRAVQSFATLFGNSHGVLPEINDPAARAQVLGALVRAAYKFVRLADDRVHEGVYSPDVRDHAEQARDALLTALLESPGQDARDAILELAKDPLFEHMPDRLRLLARRRAASDSEPTPLQPIAVVDLEKRFEIRPRNRDELFGVMLDRLDDLAHDIADDDFSNRATLRSIGSEHQMQLELARRLREMARGAYQVTREEEVADRKETDIRLSTIEASHRAVIEIKIADNDWTIEDLHRALTNQLVGQYLRHDTCKAGCLLLTYGGKKKYWLRSGSDRQVPFEEVVQELQTHAVQIESESRDGYRLAVAALDLRDPVLPEAHR